MLLIEGNLHLMKGLAKYVLFHLFYLFTGARRIVRFSKVFVIQKIWCNQLA